MAGGQSTGVHLAFSNGYRGGVASSILYWTPWLRLQREGGAQDAQRHRDDVSHACCCEICPAWGHVLGRTSTENKSKNVSFDQKEF